MKEYKVWAYLEKHEMSNDGEKDFHEDIREPECIGIFEEEDAAQNFIDSMLI